MLSKKKDKIELLSPHLKGNTIIIFACVHSVCMKERWHMDVHMSTDRGVSAYAHTHHMHLDIEKCSHELAAVFSTLRCH